MLSSFHFFYFPLTSKWYVPQSTDQYLYLYTAVCTSWLVLSVLTDSSPLSRASHPTAKCIEILKEVQAFLSAGLNFENGSPGVFVLRYNHTRGYYI